MRAVTLVLVVGATGGIGVAAVQLAHAMGARVFATTRDTRKGTRLYDLGAAVRLPEWPGHSGGVSVRLQWHAVPGCQCQRCLGLGQRPCRVAELDPANDSCGS